MTLQKHGESNKDNNRNVHWISSAWTETVATCALNMAEAKKKNTQRPGKGTHKRKRTKWMYPSPLNCHVTWKRPIIVRNFKPLSFFSFLHCTGTWKDNHANANHLDWKWLYCLQAHPYIFQHKKTILQAEAVKGLRTSATQTLDSTVLTRWLCMAVSCTERRSTLQDMCWLHELLRPPGDC